MVLRIRWILALKVQGRRALAIPSNVNSTSAPPARIPESNRLIAMWKQTRAHFITARPDTKGVADTIVQLILPQHLGSNRSNRGQVLRERMVGTCRKQRGNLTRNMEG